MELIFLENGVTPIELIGGVKKEKFTIKDVYNIYGYMSLVLLWHKIRSVNDGHTQQIWYRLS
jgi:hypothetical protein